VRSANLNHWKIWLLAALLGGGCWAGEGWTQFRGPRGDGTALNAHPPLTWGEGSNITWQVTVPGRGRSSPVVSGRRLWLTTALLEGNQRKRIGSDDMQVADHAVLQVLCYDTAKGKPVWTNTLFTPAKPDPVHWLNSWATPTPVFSAGRLYCDFGTYGTACLDAQSGRTIWEKQIPCDHQVGPGSSPVLWKNLMILVRDGRDAQFVVALRQDNGEVAWKTERPPIRTSSPDLRKSFVTPLIVPNSAKPQLIAPAAHWTVSYDPDNGHERWRLRHGEGFSIGTCPVATADTVLFGTGCFKPQLLAVRLDGEGDVTASHLAWKSLRQVPIMSSPVLRGEEVYYVSDDGMATCAEVKTGNAIWQERLGEGHLASPLLAEDRIYFFGKEGKTTVVAAGRTFQRLAENKLPGTLIATPAMVDKAIYLRTDEALYRIEAKRGR